MRMSGRSTVSRSSGTMSYTRCEYTGAVTSSLPAFTSATKRISARRS